MRPKAQHENDLHKTMHRRDVAEGGTRGALLGAVAGGLRGKSLPGAAAGAGLGMLAGHLKGKERQLRDTTNQERQQIRADERKKKAFVEKVSALAPMVRTGLLERSTAKLMRPRPPIAPRAPLPGAFGISTVTKTSHPTGITDSTTASHEDLLPETFKGLKKRSMIHPEMQGAVEGMTAGKWKQTLKHMPVSILAGGTGYGIGRVITEMIGESALKAGTKPAWLGAMPLVMSGLSMAGAYAGSRHRDAMKAHREAGE
jgi:hypothetical protein